MQHISNPSPPAPTILYVYYKFKTNLEALKSILIIFHQLPGIKRKGTKSSSGHLDLVLIKEQITQVVDIRIQLLGTRSPKHGQYFNI